MVGAKSLKIFQLILIIQESLEGSLGYVNFTGNFQLESHFLRVTFHIVGYVHNSLLHLSSYNLVQGPSLLIILQLCHKSWDSVVIHLQTSQLPQVKTHHF